jgi:hypothetical protein
MVDSPMGDIEHAKTYDDWANDPEGEPSGPPLSLEDIRERVRVGTEQLDRGPYVTKEQVRSVNDMD